MPQTKDEGWVTIKVAHEQTGASISAMRNWYRDGLIDSKEVNTRYGPQKMVRLDEVQAKVDSFRPEPTAPQPPVGLPTLAGALRMLADASERIAVLELENAAMGKVISVLAGSDYAARELVEAEKV